eukprot:1158464-Pelagomonas_calceolata.AAC.3
MAATMALLPDGDQEVSSDGGSLPMPASAHVCRVLQTLQGAPVFLGSLVSIENGDFMGWLLSKEIMTAYVRSILPRNVAKYWLQRYSLFTKYDEGIQVRQGKGRNRGGSMCTRCWKLPE